MVSLCSRIKETSSMSVTSSVSMEKCKISHVSCELGSNGTLLYVTLKDKVLLSENSMLQTGFALDQRHRSMVRRVK